jgi:hypothetical protein
MKTAVTLMIFNRPDTTLRVFEAIAQARPRKLLVIADGPRSDRPGEAERCAAARAVIDRVDWDCQVLTNFSDVNLGCRRRVASGLDWVFEQVEDSIVLEDDCLPHPDFFRFCDQLLDHYRVDARIMAIGGNNFFPDRSWSDGSYYFSRYCSIWGWATWRRAWSAYDIEMTSLPDFLQRPHDYLADPAEARHWEVLFRATRDGLIDTWDYQWQFAVLRQHGLTIVPNVNLVSNIGFGPDATHTKDRSDRGAVVPLRPLPPLRHPSIVARSKPADRLFYRTMHQRSFLRRARSKLGRCWKVFNLWRGRSSPLPDRRSADPGISR